MYQVIIIHDEKKERDYYQSYTDEGGNIETKDLPPYADLNKARSCYWNPETEKWVYDKDKYSELIQIETEEKAKREEEAAIAAATPTNEELAESMMELAELISGLIMQVDDLSKRMEE